MLSFDKALIVSMMITGKITAVLRLKFGCYLSRYLSGETSLVEDRVAYEQRMAVLKSPTGDIEAYERPCIEACPATGGPSDIAIATKMHPTSPSNLIVVDVFGRPEVFVRGPSGAFL